MVNFCRWIEFLRLGLVIFAFGLVKVGVGLDYVDFGLAQGGEGLRNSF